MTDDLKIEKVRSFFTMNLPSFMNVDLYKLKPDCEDDYFRTVSRAKFEGMKKDISLRQANSITVMLAFGKVPMQ